jgi:hypothetical protein
VKILLNFHYSNCVLAFYAILISVSILFAGVSMLQNFVAHKRTKTISACIIFIVNEYTCSEHVKATRLFVAFFKQLFKKSFFSSSQ